MMTTVTLDFPDELVSSVGRSTEDFADKLRLAAAIHWYSRGEISQETAAQVAGLDRTDFLMALSRDRVNALGMESALLERITFDPEIFGGKPIIRGRRLAVEHVLGTLAAGDDFDTILQGYPWLEQDDILACLAYARRLVDHERGEKGVLPTVQEAREESFHVEEDRAAKIDRALAALRRFEPAEADRLEHELNDLRNA